MNIKEIQQVMFPRITVFGYTSNQLN